MLTLVTGGTRSGKSSYASSLALALSNEPVYVATAQVWDSEFGERVQRHVNDRDHRWTTHECQMEVSKLPIEGKVVVIDCVTLWLTNYFVRFEQDVDKCLEAFKAEIAALQKLNANIFIISNELGMGLHAETAMGRKFTDLQGWANQYVASLADRVVFMVSGIPWVIK